MTSGTGRDGSLARRDPRHRRRRLHRLAHRRRAAGRRATRSACSTCCWRPRTASGPTTSTRAPSSSRATSATRTTIARAVDGRDRRLPPVRDGRPRRRPGRHRRLRLPQRPRHRRCCCARSPPARFAGHAGARLEHGRLRRGPLPLRRARASSGPARARPEDLDGGQFEPPCPVCGRPLDAGVRARGRPAGPAQRLRRDQGRPGAPVHRVRPRDRRDRSPRCATTTSTVRGCRATRRTPAWPASSAPRWRPGARRACSRTARSGSDFVHVRDVAAANVRALRGRASRARSTSRPARRARVGDMAAALARAVDPSLAPVVTGQWRAGDVRHVFASPERASAELGFTRGRGLRGGHARVRRGEAARMTRFAVVGHVEWIEFGRFTHVPEPGEIIDATDVVLRGRGQRRRRRRPAGQALRRRRLLHRARHRRARAPLARAADRARRARPRRAARAMQRWGFVHLTDDGERTISIVGERHAPARRRRPAVGAPGRRRRRLRLRRRQRRDAPGAPARSCWSPRRAPSSRWHGIQHRRARRQRQGPARAGRPATRSTSSSSSPPRARRAAPGRRASSATGTLRVRRAARPAGRRVRRRRHVRRRADLRARRGLARSTTRWPSPPARARRTSPAAARTPASSAAERPSRGDREALLGDVAQEVHGAVDRRQGGDLVRHGAGAGGGRTGPRAVRRRPRPRPATPSRRRPAPRSATRSAFSGWSANSGTTASGMPAAIAASVEPEPPWPTIADGVGHDRALRHPRLDVHVGGHVAEVGGVDLGADRQQHAHRARPPARRPRRGRPPGRSRCPPRRCRRRRRRAGRPSRPTSPAAGAARGRGRAEAAHAPGTPGTPGCSSARGASVR